MNIGYKTSGMLFNELITASLKYTNLGEKEEFLVRARLIAEELERREFTIKNESTQKYEDIRELFEALFDTLIEMWDVVEEVTRLRKQENKEEDKWAELGKQADKSYRLNAERTEYIRRIDKILGEEEFTFLEKSYH